MPIISGRLRLWNARAAHRALFQNGLAGVSQFDCQAVNCEIGLGVKSLEAHMFVTSNDRRLAAASRRLKLVTNHPMRRVRKKV